MKHFRTLIMLTLLVNCVNARATNPPDRWNLPYSNDIALTENNGQLRGTDGQPVPHVQFYSTRSLPRAYIQKQARISLVLTAADTNATTLDTLRRLDLQPTGPAAAYPDAISYVVKSNVHNFYWPWCGPNGVTDVHSYSGIKYPDMWPYIDMLIYGTKGGQQMSFVIRPGGDPADLQLLFNGQDELGIDVYGYLKLLMSGKEFKFPQAVAYQVNTDNTVVPMSWIPSYTADNGTGVMGFTFSGYDRNKTLVFQIGQGPLGGPMNTEGVCWGTYVAGDDEAVANASAVDADGNYYQTGGTSAYYYSFPNNNVGENHTYLDRSCYISKYDTDHQIQWTSMVGGQAGNSGGMAMAIKPGTNRLYVGGRTNAQNFYCTGGGNGIFYRSTATSQASFITRIDLGSNEGNIDWSTYFGDVDVYLDNMTIDPQGRLIIVGMTKGDLPVHEAPLPANAEQWNFSGGVWDGFIAMFTPADSLLRTTFIGGSGQDKGLDVEADGQSIFVAGSTSSGNIPLLDGGPQAWDTTQSGGMDVFILEFNPNGVQRWGTYYGGSGYDVLGVHGMSLADKGFVLVGETQSTDFTIRGGSRWQDSTSTSPSYVNGFIAEFFSDTRTLLWSTYASGTGDSHLQAVVAQSDDYLFVSGSHFSGSFPLEFHPNIFNLGPSAQDGFAVIMCFDRLRGLVWSTLYGGTSPLSAHVDGRALALDDREVLYLSGWTTVNRAYGYTFPLTDPGEPAWYQGSYGISLPWTAYVAAFCTADVLVGIPQHEERPHDTAFFVSADGQLTFFALSNGLHHLRIVNTLGELVWQGTLQGYGSSLVSTPMPPLSGGVYLLVVDDQAYKFQAHPK